MSETEESGTMKYWNIGNTTVRDPGSTERGVDLPVREALRVFRDNYEGKGWTEKDQRNFYDLLVKEGIVKESERGSAPESRGITGRKWVSIFHKFGLKRWEPASPVAITEIGNLYLTGAKQESDIFLRQLLKYRLPNPFEKGKEYSGFDVHPFYVILQIAYQLQSMGKVGISKEELALFVVTCVKDSKIDETIKKILYFRSEFDRIQGRVRRSKYFRERKIRLLATLHRESLDSRKKLLETYRKKARANPRFANSSEGISLLETICAGGKGPNTKKSLALQRLVKESVAHGDSLEASFLHVQNFVLSSRADTLNDYADTARRYSKFTGLFTVSKNKLAILSSKLADVKQILESFESVSFDDFKELFYIPDFPPLPTDRKLDVSATLNLLYSEYIRLCQRLSKEVAIPPPPQGQILVGNYESELKKVIVNLRFESFAVEQRTQEQVNNILEVWQQIQDHDLIEGRESEPAYFEWLVWRFFLAINSLANPITETFNFKVDDDMNPLGTAQGGRPDLLFRYNDLTVVGEVTLTTGNSQWAREYESVPRHIADEMAKDNCRSSVCGVFVVTKIDKNMLHQAFTQSRFVKCEGQERLTKIDIVPFEMDLLVPFLKYIPAGKWGAVHFKDQILKEAIRLKAVSSDAIDWYSRIKKLIETELESLSPRLV
jgi:hypothetical protein